jgi:hypothetical protein
MFGTEELGPDELNRSAETGPLIRPASIVQRAQGRHLQSEAPRGRAVRERQPGQRWARLATL